MASDVSMCSTALLLIGHSKISALTENEQAEAFYDVTYEELLTSHTWNFATKKSVSLSRLTATPENEFSYAYQLPSDLLVLDHTYPASSYKIYGDKLYSNNSSVEIDYLVKPAESLLPPYFVRTMELRLASLFAVPVTSNKSTAELYDKMFERQLLRAKFLDGKQQPSDSIQDSPFTDIRGG